MLLKLHAQTLDLWANRPRRLTCGVVNRISKAHNKRNTELPVLSISWLRGFAVNRYNAPDVNKVELLYVILTGKELDL
jgi:hypothetical protein